jgi:hypothetical protein
MERLSSVRQIEKKLRSSGLLASRAFFVIVNVKYVKVETFIKEDCNASGEWDTQTPDALTVPFSFSCVYNFLLMFTRVSWRKIISKFSLAKKAKIL